MSTGLLLPAQLESNHWQLIPLGTVSRVNGIEPEPVPKPETLVVQLIWPDLQPVNVKANVPHGCSEVAAELNNGGNRPPIIR